MVVGLGSGVVLISLLGSAQTVPRAGLCSLLGAPGQRRWLYGSSENMGTGALLSPRITKSDLA